MRIKLTGIKHEILRQKKGVGHTPDKLGTNLSPNPFYYDLNGKRVDTPHKGVIIRNGKKYVSK